MIVDFILGSAMVADKNDIFYKPPTADEWKTLYDSYYLKIEKIESKAFEKKYQEFGQDILTITAAASKSLEHNEISFGAAVNTALNAVYYKIFSTKGKQQAEMFLSSPDPKTATNVITAFN